MTLTANFERLEFSTAQRGLNHDGFAMRLWRKAKKFGIWNPDDIDYTQDARDWQNLTEPERELMMHLAGVFQSGEESVTLDLLPLMQVIANEGRIEEEMYLTSFLWEEAKHIDAFDRFWRSVAQVRPNLEKYHTSSYRAVFYEALPQALHRLRSDPSPVALAEASVIYNMIVEGTLAETGYQAYGTMLERRGIMPGMRRVMTYFKQDESRHIAYGVHLLSRLVSEHGDPVWNAIEAKMNEMLVHALGVVGQMFEPYSEMPFGLEQDEFIGFALGQFQKRLLRIERARNLTLDQVLGVESVALEVEEVVQPA
jgi:ribonucleoside-diphosphate reductase beta chain